MATKTILIRGDGTLEEKYSGTGTRTTINDTSFSYGGSSRSATYAQISATSKIVYPARSDYWTQTDWGVLVVANPVDVYPGSDPSTVFAIRNSAGVFELCFHGNHQGGSGGSDAICCYEFQSGATRVGAYSDGQCTGVPNAWFVRRVGSTIDIFRADASGDKKVTTGQTVVGTAVDKSTATPYLNAYGDDIGKINRDAPVAAIVFYDGTVTDGEVLAALADPFAEFSTGATITGNLGTATAAGFAASIAAAVTISCALGGAVASGHQSSISTGSNVTISCAVGTATASGYSATVTSSGSATITTDVFKNNTGTVLSSTSIPKAVAIKLSDLTIGASWTNQTTDGSGVLSLTGSMASGDYLLVVSNADGSAVGVKKYTAS